MNTYIFNVSMGDGWALTTTLSKVSFSNLLTNNFLDFLSRKSILGIDDQGLYLVFELGFKCICVDQNASKHVKIVHI